MLTDDTLITSQQTSLYNNILQIDNVPLVDQTLTAQGRHRVTFYEEAGQLKANVEVNALRGFSKSYEGINVYVEQGAVLAKLPFLEAKAQERRIHIHLAKANQPVKVVIYKGAGLAGGGKDKRKGKEKLNEDEEPDGEKEDDLNRYQRLVSLAMEGEAEAQFLLGQIAYELWKKDVKKEDAYQEAINWLNQAAKQEHEAAIVLLKELDQPNLVEQEIKKDQEKRKFEEVIAEEQEYGASKRRKEKHKEENVKEQIQLGEEDLKVAGQDEDCENRQLWEDLASLIREFNKDKNVKIKVRESAVKGETQGSRSISSSTFTSEQKAAIRMHQFDSSINLATWLTDLPQEILFNILKRGVSPHELLLIGRFYPKLNDCIKIILWDLFKEAINSEKLGEAEELVPIIVKINTKNQNLFKELSEACQQAKNFTNKNLFKRLSQEIGKVQEVIRKEIGTLNLHFVDVSLCDSLKLDTTNKDAFLKSLSALIEKKKLDINKIYGTGGGWTLLHLAASINHIEALNLLLRNNANVNIQNKSGKTPLCRAVEIGYKDVVKYLIEKGASVDIKYNNLIEKGASVDIKYNNETPLGYAIRNDKIKIARLLLKHTKNLHMHNDEYRPLMHKVASHNCNLEIAEFLLEQGFDINARSNLGNTPLHTAISLEKLKIAMLLIEKGADVNIRNEKGQTPLHLAVEKGSPEMFQLHTAISLEKLKIIAMLLIEKGADVNIRNEKGQTPLHLAAEKGSPEMFQLLIAAQGALYIKNNVGKTVLDLAEQISYVEIIADLIGRTNNDKQTLLHLAILKNNLPVVKYLLKFNTNKAKDKFGNTPLHVAVEKGYIEIVKLLLKSEADVNAVNNIGETPLHKVRNKNIAELLIVNGADVNAKDVTGDTPLRRNMSFAIETELKSFVRQYKQIMELLS
jgi:ankyrin repeat protein